MTIAIRIDGLLAKDESGSGYGVDAVPSAVTDAVRVSERVWSSLRVIHAFPNKRKSTASGTGLPVQPGAQKGRYVTLRIVWEIRGPGANYGAASLPEADPLIRSCSHTRTDTFPTMVQYAPVVPANPSTATSCTIYAYAGGLLYKIVGCRGTMEWNPRLGELGAKIFNMTGLLLADPTEAALPAITYDATLPQPCVGMGLSVGGVWSPDALSMGFTQNANVIRKGSMNSTDGLKEILIPSMDPHLTLQADVPAFATYNPFADSHANPRVARTIVATLGSVAKNQMTFSVQNAYVNDPGTPEVEELAYYDLDYDLPDYLFTYL